MSDVENEIPESPAPTEKLTPEQKVQHVKNNLLNTLAQFHNQLFYFIDTTPIDEHSKQFAHMNLVQATRWAEDAIKALVFTVEEPPKPTEGEPSNAIEEGNQQENNSEQHQEGSEIGQETCASSSDCLQESGQEPSKEEVIKPTEGA